MSQGRRASRLPLAIIFRAFGAELARREGVDLLAKIRGGGVA